MSDLSRNSPDNAKKTNAKISAAAHELVALSVIAALLVSGVGFLLFDIAHSLVNLQATVNPAQPVAQLPPLTENVVHLALAQLKSESEFPRVPKAVSKVLMQQEARLYDSAIPRDYLVVIPAGDHSLHIRNEWHRRPRVHDLCIIFYGKDPEKRQLFNATADYFFAMKGLQYVLLGTILRGHNFWRRYRYIWFPSDDLRMTLPSLTLLFATVDAFALSLSMPAVTGHYAHPITARQPHCYLRYTNFAEGMAPLFRAEHIDDVFLPALRGLPADDPGWGVDTAWLQWLDYKNIAVIDAVEMCHTRPLGAQDRKRDSIYNGIDPIARQQETMKRLGVSMQPHREYVRYCLPDVARIDHPPDSWTPSSFMPTMNSPIG